ncbi:hypothetical protein CXB51_025960 [Gossypium anomalum]|uniref:Protein TIC 22-like, chloroplastic n=1 Tax=Gossypium anomalum TaxID=47600 RepID=A0A8J5Z4N8_9ROSI|nr:hypothetical protein CXB51_025960 [Gossypium anomalum]
MNPPSNSKTPKIFSPFKQTPPLQDLQQAFSNIQTHCSSLFRQTQYQLMDAFNSTFSHFNPPSFSPKGPVFARIADSSKTQIALSKKNGAAMPAEKLERLAGVPVYALSNSEEEFVLVSGVSTKKSLGLLCFKKEDAEALLEQMKSMDPGMRKGGSKVVAVALNKVVQLQVAGVALRLVPESTQIKNALRKRAKKAGESLKIKILYLCVISKVVKVLHNDVKLDQTSQFNWEPADPAILNGSKYGHNVYEMAFSSPGNKGTERAGFSDDSFPGVPVFQSRSLVLRSQNKSYRPVFFRRLEDLEQSLLRASRDQNQLNPAFRPGDIQVAVFEDIIKGMKDTSTSNWDDVVFIPPGFDVSTDPTQLQQ